MRGMMLGEIERLRRGSDNFNKNSNKWRGFEVERAHISELDFNELTDYDLFYAFLDVIKRADKQM